MTSRWIKTLIVAAGLMAATASHASAQTYTLRATLTGAGEATQTANGVNTGAFGNATVVVDMAARTVAWTVNVWNLPSGVTASHIHVGSALTAGPVIVDFTVPTTASNDFGFSGTAADTTFRLQPERGIRSADDAFQAIVAGNAYVNVHSAVNPGGEIRGQLVLVP